MNPYSVPVTPGATPPLHDGGAPQVWTWYVAYAISMAVLYLVVSVAGVVLLVSGATLRGAAPDADVMVASLAMSVVGLSLLGAFAVAPFLPKAPWAWTFHLVLICLGLTSACCLPASLPLLIYWLKPETKAFFGRASY